MSADLSIIISLCEKCPNTEFFLGPYSVQMPENTDKRKIRIWTLSAQFLHPVFNDWFTFVSDQDTIKVSTLAKGKLSQPPFKLKDLTWQEIWQISIHLFKVRWNDRLVNYFPFIYRYGINTNMVHLTFPRAQLSSFLIKC